jgi:hypothetical protein
MVRLLVVPLEADSPLVANANAVLPISIASEGLETISRQGGEISQRRCGFQTVQLDTSRALDAGKRLDPVPESEGSRALVPIAEDHVTRIAYAIDIMKMRYQPCTSR